MKNIKSQSHVEMMISFVLFVGALVSIYVFMNPITETNEKLNQVKVTEDLIAKNLTYAISKITIILNTTNDNYLFSTTSYDDGIGPPLHFVEKVDPSNPRKYIIYMSDVFPEDISTKNICGPTNPTALCNFSIGSYSEEDIYYYEKLLEFKQAYDSDYNKLKKSIGAASDFYIKVKNLDGSDINELSSSKKIPGGIERYSKERPIRVINYSGDINELILNINVW